MRLVILDGGSETSFFLSEFNRMGNASSRREDFQKYILKIMYFENNHDTYHMYNNNG